MFDFNGSKSSPDSCVGLSRSWKSGPFKMVSEGRAWSQVTC